MATPGRAKRVAPVADDTPPGLRDVRLLQIVDAGLAGAIFAVPLLMGGRHPLGRFTLVTLAVAVAVAWTLRQALRGEARWRRCGVQWLLAAGAMLLVLQIVPLPQSVLAWAAPRTAGLLPLWSAQADPAAAVGTWHCISLTPAATRAALPVFLAYGLLFLVTVQRIRALEDVERLLKWIAFSALAMAGFALVQLFAGNGKFFWFYAPPFGNAEAVAKGSFANRNHFAHFLALGIGPLVWWLQHNSGDGRQRRAGTFPEAAAAPADVPRRPAYRGLALAVVLFAGLLSLSRGGVAVMFLAAAVSVAVCRRAKTISPRVVLSLAAAGVLMAALLTVYGGELGNSRLNVFNADSIEAFGSFGGRREIWETVAKAIPDYALFGSGIGSHVEVYPMYLEKSPGAEYTHAESGPLQVLLEGGTVGLALVLLGVVCCGRWCVGGLWTTRSSRLLVCLGAVAASLAASVVHALCDFVWYVPGCMAVVAVLAGCACRLWQMAAADSAERTRVLAVPRFAAIAAVVLLLAGGTWMIGSRVGPALAAPHWQRYQVMSLAAARSRPHVGGQPSAAGVEKASLAGVERMITSLQRVVRYKPHHARARLRLAAAYLRRFELAQREAENAMPLAQIRDAAHAARAAARNEAQRRDVEQWLRKTIGDHYEGLEAALHHTREGLALCPLQGEGYLYLAELRFLEGPVSDTVRRAYVEQALRVRPYDGAVLFEAGREAWQAGNADLWLDYWRRSFQSGPKHKRQLIEALAGRVPVEFIAEVFPLDVHAARMLHYCCRALNNPEQTAQAARVRVRLARQEAERLEGSEAAGVWLEAVWLYGQLDDWPAALECAESALRAQPDNYDVRHTLARCLMRRHRYAEAESHLNWCRKRRPEDEQLLHLTREAVKGRLEREGPVLCAEKPQATHSRTLPR